MYCVQVKMALTEEDGTFYPEKPHGGIAVYADEQMNELLYVICAHCGATFYPDEVMILESYEGSWIDIDEEVMGT